MLAKTRAREEKPGKGIPHLGSKGGEQEGQDVPRSEEKDGAVRESRRQTAPRRRELIWAKQDSPSCCSALFLPAVHSQTGRTGCISLDPPGASIGDNDGTLEVPALK